MWFKRWEESTVEKVSLTITLKIAHIFPSNIDLASYTVQNYALHGNEQWNIVKLQILWTCVSQHNQWVLSTASNCCHKMLFSVLIIAATLSFKLKILLLWFHFSSSITRWCIITRRKLTNSRLQLKNTWRVSQLADKENELLRWSDRTEIQRYAISSCECVEDDSVRRVVHTTGPIMFTRWVTISWMLLHHLHHDCNTCVFVKGADVPHLNKKYRTYTNNYTKTISP